MAIPKKGSRRITVDGTDYRWAIRKKPTYGQALEESNLAASVEVFDAPGATLVLRFPFTRPDAWFTYRGTSVTPAAIASGIRKSIELGWDGTVQGATFHTELSSEDNV